MDIGESAYDWDNNEELEEKHKLDQAAMLERAKAYHHLFAQDPIGQKILTEWINSYCTGNVPGNDASMRQVSMRDGKQQLVQFIIQQIQIATGENQQ